jgi:hypothetical protein
MPWCEGKIQSATIIRKINYVFDAGVPLLSASDTAAPAAWVGSNARRAYGCGSISAKAQPLRNSEAARAGVTKLIRLNLEMLERE